MRAARTAEDLDAARARAAVRLERRRRPDVLGTRREDAAGRLVREAAALVAAIDAMREENMNRWSHGDR